MFDKSQKQVRLNFAAFVCVFVFDPPPPTLMRKWEGLGGVVAPAQKYELCVLSGSQKVAESVLGYDFFALSKEQRCQDLPQMGLSLKQHHPLKKLDASCTCLVGNVPGER